MKISTLTAVGLFVFGALVVWPQIDLIVSGWFYQPGKGFVLADQPLFLALHWLAYYGARALGAALTVLTVIAALRREPVWAIDAKGWLFLFLGLLLAPGLIANAGFKDHWGRARPREIAEFGGTAVFSPALVPQENGHKNSSFVSGDAAFGFFLPAFAYVAPRRHGRRVFWGGIGAGFLLGFARLAMGAHFLSDILFAALFMLAATAALHAALFGAEKTKNCWREWVL